MVHESKRLYLILQLYLRLIIIILEINNSHMGEARGLGRQLHDLFRVSLRACTRIASHMLRLLSVCPLVMYYTVVLSKIASV